MNRLYLPPAAAIGVLAVVAMIRTAAADSTVPCSGDDAACQAINITAGHRPAEGRAFSDEARHPSGHAAAVNDTDPVDRLVERQLRFCERHLREPESG
jgi:hypothetical protein